VSHPHWRVVAASVRGASHEKVDVPCQDAHKWAVASDGLLVVAVADGAGSALLAEVGAVVAAGAATEFLCQSFAPSGPDRMDDSVWRGLLAEAVAAARNAIETEARQRAAALCDLASTLIVVVAGADFVAAIQVGDGAVVAARTDGQILSVTRPAQAEYLNETVFLTSSEAMATAQSVVWRGSIAHLAVLSDGLQMAALHMPDGEPHPGFFTPLFNFLAQQKEDAVAQDALTTFLSSPRLRERTDDDVTLVIGTLRS
jgi:hypothetical protein